MVCTATIGRKYSLLVGSEATAGTEASAFVSIPLTIAPFIKPVVEMIEEESGYGRIEAISNKYITKTMSETAVEGRVGQTTFGHILKAGFGASTAGALVETGVYKHSFTVQNDNCHQSYSLVEDGLVGQEISLYNLLDTLSMNFAVGEIARFSSTFKGKIYTGTSGKTVSFVDEEPFKISQMTVKFASAIAGLGGASATPLNEINFEIAKNVIDITETGSLDPTEIFNQDFRVTGDMEVVYENDTYRDYVTAGTKRAMSISILGETLLGATKYAELYFEFASLNFDEWDRSNDNNAILTQTLGFTSEYSLSDTSQLTGYIQNAQSTQY